MPHDDARVLDSDAPLTAAVHQRDLAHGVAKAMDWSTAALAGRTVTINRPRAEIYAFWRDFQNLAKFLENIERVEPLGGNRSHWVVSGPGGRTVEWDSELTEDVPGEVLAWESGDGDIKNAGRVEFRDGPPGRGTEVTATLIYEPPAGEVGKLIAKLFQKEPKIQARRDLRRLKQLLETGEISTARPTRAAA